MKYFVSILILLFFCACEFINFKKQESESFQPIASVYNTKLYHTDIANLFPKNITQQDSLILAKSLITTWATKQLLLRKSEENSSMETSEKINRLVKDYRESLLINNYKEILIKQQLDTLIEEKEISAYYTLNRENFKLNEELIKVKYLSFNNNLAEKKELIKLFKSNEMEDIEELIKKELSFTSYQFNDTIWTRLDKVLLKVPFSKEKLLKKTKFAKKQDSLGLYLVAVKDVLVRNSIAPLSYIKPRIKQMILHKRKIELIREIEKIIVKDATQNKNFRIY
ncbi:MAG: hypothetical protein ACPGTO_04850 [Polaribacter sp.]